MHNLKTDAQFSVAAYVLFSVIQVLFLIEDTLVGSYGRIPIAVISIIIYTITSYCAIGFLIKLEIKCSRVNILVTATQIIMSIPMLWEYDPRIVLRSGLLMTLQLLFFVFRMIALQGFIVEAERIISQSEEIKKSVKSGGEME